jgi:hypothetical protein
MTGSRTQVDEGTYVINNPALNNPRILQDTPDFPMMVLSGAALIFGLILLLFSLANLISTKDEGQPLP